MPTDRYIQLDEEGYFLSNGQRYTDAHFGAELLKNLKYDNRALYTESDGQLVRVEAYSEPLVARHVWGPHDSVGPQLEFPYGLRADLDPRQLFVDEWDRFRGFSRLPSGLAMPLVLSRTAQNDLFELAESFDDESISLFGSTYTIGDWYNTTANVGASQFWSEHYSNWQNDETKPGWELKEPAAPLRDISAQLKLNKSRIIVLGCGTGHDAAYFAQQGHHVTGLDFSSEAISRARAQYGHISNLQFVQADALRIPPEMKGQFDIVFEHTFFCAIDPHRRADAVKTYKQLLAPQGHLLGIFFILDPSPNPPFGMTEWELKEHLKNKFHTLYWTRWRRSIAPRAGKEIVVYAQAKNFG
jgi:SAM-dependent methyltransferase